MRTCDSPWQQCINVVCLHALLQKQLQSDKAHCLASEVINMTNVQLTTTHAFAPDNDKHNLHPTKLRNSQLACFSSFNLSPALQAHASTATLSQCVHHHAV